MHCSIMEFSKEEKKEIFLLKNLWNCQAKGLIERVSFYKEIRKRFELHVSKLKTGLVKCPPRDEIIKAFSLRIEALKFLEKEVKENF